MGTCQMLPTIPIPVCHVDNLMLLSNVLPPEAEMMSALAAIRGEGNAEDVIMTLGNDVLLREDIIQLDGPHIPSGKCAHDIWLSGKVLAYFRHFLDKNDLFLCSQVLI